MGIIKILGYHYIVSLEGTVDDLGSMGRFQSIPQKIQIANDLTSEQRESTLLHEIIEALDFHLELKLEHKQMMGIEAGIYQALKDAGVDLSPLVPGE